MITRRASIWLDIASLIIIGLVTLTEAPLVEARLLPFYLISRAVIMAAFIAHLAFNRFNQTIWYGVVWAGLFYVYSLFGEICRPLYILSIFQIQVIHATYFVHSRLSYILTIVLGTGAFIVTLWMMWPTNLIRMQEAALGDQVTIAFSALISAMFVFFYLERVRRQSAAAVRKLALAGSYATSLIHDIKNLSSGPLLYSELLSSKKLTENEFAKVLLSLNQDLKRIEYVTKELYDSSRINESVYTDCSLRDVCVVASEIVGDRLDGINVTLSGDHVVRTDRTILQMVVLNLFYNAATALRHVADRKITISIEDKRLTFANPLPRERSAKSGIGLALMNELGQQSNLDLSFKEEGGQWIAEVKFRSAWTSGSRVLESI